jgi:hypothetical protein
MPGAVWKGEWEIREREDKVLWRAFTYSPLPTPYSLFLWTFGPLLAFE